MNAAPKLVLMTINNEAQFLDRLKVLVASGDPAGIEALVFDLGDLILEEGVFPQACFSGILSVLGDEKFRQIKDGWKLLRVFEYNWTELSEQQRLALLATLEASYNSFGDWMACFVISGMLGELYKDEPAFAALCRLKRTSEEIPRSLIPHGFEHFVSGAPDRTLAERAHTELRDMQTDRSEAVQREARESLLRIKQQRSSIG